MRVQLRIDGISFEIDTRNPDLLAQWLIEKFSEVNWTPATDARVFAYPSWAQGDRGWQNPVPDWITDSRFLGYPLPVRSPEGMLAALGDELAKYRTEAPA